jgi:hypothetical protein
MTYTELKAKPGQYVWDEDKIQFVGRINKDGTEDKRFSKGGLCSLLNTIIETTGYVPKQPQLFASRIAEHRKSDYLVKGYGVVVRCYDLSAEMWAAKAAELLGQECDGIADILSKVSESKASEHKAKIESLALIFGKELKSKKLADYAGVTEFEQRLHEEREQRSKEQAAEKKSEKKLKTWIQKALSNPRTLLQTALPMFECKTWRGNGDKWLLVNVTLRWCKANPAIQRAVENRYYREMDEILAEYKVDSLWEYALEYSRRNFHKIINDELTTIEEYHVSSIVSEEDYKQAKHNLLTSGICFKKYTS